MSVAHRVPSGWRQIIIDLEKRIEVVDCYEDIFTGELVIRALLEREEDRQLIKEAVEKARRTPKDGGYDPADLEVLRDLEPPVRRRDEHIVDEPDLILEDGTQYDLQRVPGETDEEFEERRSLFRDLKDD